MIERNGFETNGAGASPSLACHALSDGTLFGQSCRSDTIELLVQLVKPRAASFVERSPRML